MASLWSKIKEKASSNYTKVDSKVGGILPFGAPKTSTTQTITITKIAPETKSVKVTDFTSGESVTTETTTTPSGETTTTRTTYGGGGGSYVSPQREQQLIQAVEQLESSGKSIYVPPTPSSQKTLSQQLEDLNKTDVQEPTIIQKKGLISTASDYLSGQTGGVWLSHFGRQTGLDAPEIKKEFRESTERGIKKTIVLGVPGLFGFTAEGKFKTAWSKEPEKRVDMSLFGTSGVAGIQSEWGKSASKIRESGDITKAKQEFQGKTIEEISKDINKLSEDFSKTYDSTEFEKRAERYSTEVAGFNVAYGDRDLSPKEYDQALEMKTKLDVERTLLQEQQDFLTKGYEDYSKGVVSKVKKLRDVGVSTDIDAEGNIAFNSKALEKTIAPVGWKVQESLKKSDGSLSWKNIAYSGGAVAHTTAEAVAVGFATGGTGALAIVSTKISKLPKVAQVVKGGAITLGGVGVASKSYSGYKLAQQSNLPGWYGATFGATSGIGQIGGFMAGGYLGTKGYFSGVEKQILSGKYTQSLGAREGAIIEKGGLTKGGLARQLSMYETNVKGTKWTIKSGVKMTGQYGKDLGQSSVRAVSQFQGKAPKGFPKSWTTQAKTLESGDWVKLRAFTKSSKAKVWYEQDYLLKRTMLDKLKLDVSKSDFFKGYESAERLKFLTSIKSVGQPVKVGKTLPSNIWKQGEVFRFQQWKGQGKVMQPWEYGEAKADTTFLTKQVVAYKSAKPLSKKVGDLNVLSTDWSSRQFQSIAQSRGVSTELLKQQLKDTIMIFKESQLAMGKRGQVSLSAWKPQVTTQPPKPTLAKFPKPTTALDSNALLKINLEKIVPGLLKQQLISITPTTLALSSGFMGTKQILESKQTLSFLNDQALASKLKQVQLSKTMQQQTQFQQPKTIQKINQAQIQELALQTAVISPTITSPVIPGFPGVPIIPGLPMPDLYGWGWKEPKETLKGKTSGAYLQDFTSKVLDLKPKTLSKAQLKKLLRTDLTGLEIRRGVIPN